MESQVKPDIAQAVIKAKEKKISIWPVRYNYASEAGHECERYLYYQRTAWEQKTPHDATLQFIFDGGRYIEEQAFRELKDAGFYIVEQERPFQWKEVEVSGRIDARIQINGRLLPLEIKGLNHHEWESLDSIADMLKSKAPWVRRYPAQLLLYQAMAEEEWGLFYLKSKATYVPKVIWCNLYDHMDYLEKVLQKLERVNDAVRRESPPARIEYNEKICLDCAYFTLCSPDIELGKGAELLHDPELEGLLERREELKPLAKEYEEVDKHVKAKLKGLERGIIGEFVITGKEISGTRKPSPGGPFSYWKTTIARIPARG